MTHKAKVLSVLSDGQWHSHHQLYDLHVMGHSRVADLRHDGYVIECVRRDGSYWYRLLSKPDVADPSAPTSSHMDNGGASPRRSDSPLARVVRSSEASATSVQSGGESAATAPGSEEDTSEPLSLPEQLTLVDDADLRAARKFVDGYMWEQGQRDAIQRSHG